MKGVALGFIETRGNSGTLQAIDVMLKTADVEFVKRVEIGGGFVTTVIRGEVGAVRSSVEIGAEEAARVGELVSTNVIPSAHAETFELLGVKK
jgi:ethanolamine utilization protein EutM